MEEIKDLFRAIIYKECNILINDLSDVITEVELFTYKKLIPYITEHEECKGLLFEDIQLTYENERIVWRQRMKDEIYDPNITNVTIDTINKLFEGSEEFLKELKEEHNIENFPKDLYGKAFMCLAKTISIILDKEELYEMTDIFNIFILANNGHNNIIYEQQQ